MSFRRFLRRRQWDQERMYEFEAHLGEEMDDNVARHDAAGGAAAGLYQKSLVAGEINLRIWRLWQSDRYSRGDLADEQLCSD
jgi:hypothetical protein